MGKVRASTACEQVIAENHGTRHQGGETWATLQVRAIALERRDQGAANQVLIAWLMTRDESYLPPASCRADSISDTVKSGKKSGIRAYAACACVWFALVVVGVSRPAWALPDEFEVRLDEMAKQGEFGVEVLTSYVPTKPRSQSDEGLRPVRRVLQVTPEFSWGLTRDVQLGMQVFTSIAPGTDARMDGGRVEIMTTPVRPADEDSDGYWLGGLFEIGHLPRTLSINNLDAEFKFFIGMRRGRWTFAINPEIGFKVSGNGSSKPEYGIKFKVARRFDSGYGVGIEHYGELGEGRRIGPLGAESQLTFAVLDFSRKHWDFNVGVGRGWNDASERWVLKANVGIPF